MTTVGKAAEAIGVAETAECAAAFVAAWMVAVVVAECVGLDAVVAVGG
jgi:hypothetical protein